MNSSGYISVKTIFFIAILLALATVGGIFFLIIESKDSANLRSIEKHAKIIEYQLLKEAYLSSDEPISGEYKTLSDFHFSYYPPNDEVRCKNYVIVKGKVDKAFDCTAKGWLKSYDYVGGEKIK